MLVEHAAYVVDGTGHGSWLGEDILVSFHHLWREGLLVTHTLDEGGGGGVG